MPCYYNLCRRILWSRVANIAYISSRLRIVPWELIVWLRLVRGFLNEWKVRAGTVIDNNDILGIKFVEDRSYCG